MVCDADVWLVRHERRQPVCRGAQQRLRQALPQRQLVRQQVESQQPVPVRPQLSLLYAAFIYDEGCFV